MFQQIEQLLAQFCPCFSGKAAFGWPVTVVVGFMLRGDQLGVTSVIRDLSLSPGCYELLIRFFYSDAWDPETIRKAWWKLPAERAPVHRVRKRCILIGDGVKQSKEAFHMAGVKKLLQGSEDPSKPRYIFGHMFWAVGILISRRGNFLVRISELLIYGKSTMRINRAPWFDDDKDQRALFFVPEDEIAERDSPVLFIPL